MAKTYTLQELAALTESELIGTKTHVVSGVNKLEAATSQEVSFLANIRYLEAMKSSQAGVICIDRKSLQIPGKNYLVSDDPSRTFQQIVEVFLATPSSLGFTGIHPTALIHQTAKIAEGVTIGPYCVIEHDATIGKGTVLLAHVYIGAEVSIGEGCTLYPHVTVRERCKLNNRVIIQPGAVIGSCGFGYTVTSQGAFEKLAQVGNVVLEDDVEIGANTTVARGRFQETRICQGTKIDNLVQIAHNVRVGAHNAIAAQSGLAGSCETGSHVLMGGQVGVVGHVKIADYTQLATRSGVSKSLKSGKYRGSPAMDISLCQRQEVHIRKLESYFERIKALEQEVQELKSKNL